jgi:hypothetical protein
MNSIKKLEFNNAVVIESADGSEKYIGKYLQSNELHIS